MSESEKVAIAKIERRADSAEMNKTAKIVRTVVMVLAWLCMVRLVN